MTLFNRFVASVVMASGIGLAAMAPLPAQAQSADMIRVLVDVADVVLRGGQPYYRYGDYGQNDRLIVQRDRYGNPVYYRVLPRNGGYDPRYGGYDPRDPRYNRGQPPYGNAYGYYRNGPVTGQRNMKCNKHGKCKVEYYDPRYDRGGRDVDRRWRGYRD